MFFCAFFFCSSQACQHFDWKLGHKFQCCVKKTNSTQETSSNQDWPADENVTIIFLKS